MRGPVGRTNIGIIAGGGDLPVSVARLAVANGHDIHVIGIDGEAKSEIEAFPHSWMKWGELGKLLTILKKEDCKDVVIIGSVTRPDLSQVKVDFGAIKNLPFLLSLTVGGDNSVLSGIVKFFEESGFQVRGAHEIAPDLVCPVGTLGQRHPSARDEKDIQIAMKVVRTLGALDVGQAAVAARGLILAVEAAEGTDAMLERSAVLRQWGKNSTQSLTGVLVKWPKPTQEIRIDMPTVGSRTIEKAADAGLAGVALAAGQVLLADRDELISKADQLGLFVIGLNSDYE